MPLQADLKQFKTTSACDKCYVMGADATGDIPHVIAAMKKDDKAAVVVFEWGNNTAARAVDTLKGLKVPAQKIFTASAAEIRAALDLVFPTPLGRTINGSTMVTVPNTVKGLTIGLSVTGAGTPPNATIAAYVPGEITLSQGATASARSVKLAFGDRTPLDRNQARNKVSALCKDKAGLAVIFLHQSTDIAKTAVEDGPVRKALHKDLRGDKTLTDEDENFGAFWDIKKVPTNRHIVILWGRSSGKDKATETSFGPHPYGDSGTEGLVQVAKECIKKDWTVVIAGDVAESKKDRFPAGSFFIGRFWKDTHWKGTPPTQFQQLRLFYILKLALKPAASCTWACAAATSTITRSPARTWSTSSPRRSGTIALRRSRHPPIRAGPRARRSSPPSGSSPKTGTKNG